jgi:hypothetical protein
MKMEQIDQNEDQLMYIGATKDLLNQNIDFIIKYLMTARNSQKIVEKKMALTIAGRVSRYSVDVIDFDMSKEIIQWTPL